MEQAKRIRSIYFPGCAFPLWVLDPQLWQEHDFTSVKVFYKASENFYDVKLLMKEREPCNIGLKRLYGEQALQTNFGHDKGGYSVSTSDKLMPNIAVYTHATVKLLSGYKKVHVINLIGAAFDHPEQPDFVYFRNRPLTEVIAFYRNMWSLALAALLKTSCTSLQIYNVGGGAFAGPYSNFIKDIFEPAMKPLLPLFEKHGRSVVGYDWLTHTFTGGFIPDCLETANLEDTMFVNAWDPWSLIGNGNERDGSLDGYWGRVSNMSVLGWLPTNPHMRFFPV